MAVYPAIEGLRPSRRRRVNREGWTRAKRESFLQALEASLNVRASADGVKLSAASAYRLRQRDVAFANGWKAALDQGYARLEFDLVRLCAEGSVRTETVLDPETLKATQVKLVHSFPLGIALRLLAFHRGEVEGYRRSEAERAEDELTGAEVRRQMDIVRARLFGYEDEAEEDAGAGPGAAGVALIEGPGDGR